MWSEPAAFGVSKEFRAREVFFQGTSRVESGLAYVVRNLEILSSKSECCQAAL